MTVTEERKLQFRPRARIIRTIGDQLISGPEAAVIELVKNAYDADASFALIKFRPPLQPGKGKIVFTDDGAGMTLADIQNKWMEPATTSKTATRLSAKKQRRMMGSKGIGRFAVAKLGSKMAMNSISAESGKQIEVLIPELDWGLFAGEAYLSDISIDYLVEETDQHSGTTIEISELNEGWPSEKLEKLYRELRRLISPHNRATDDKFGIFLDLSECTPENAGFDGLQLLGFRPPAKVDHTAVVPQPEFEVLPFPLLETSDYEVDGYFDAAGKFHGTIEIRRGGQAARVIKLSVPLIENETSCGQVSVRLSIFDREADAVRETVKKAGFGSVTAKEARQLLDSVAGI